MEVYQEKQDRMSSHFFYPNTDERVCLSLSRCLCEATGKKNCTTLDVVVFVVFEFALQQYLQHCVCGCFHISDTIMALSCVRFTEADLNSAVIGH